MAPQPTTQTTASGSSTAPASSAGPGQRTHVHLDWSKDEKTKTAKCKLCGSRVKSYSMKCGRCMKRICSECIEEGGERDAQNKAVADDNINQGCWCGFKTQINPAFKGRLPIIHNEPVTAAVKKKQPAAKKPSVSTRTAKLDSTLPAPTAPVKKPSISTSSTRSIKTNAATDGRISSAQLQDSRDAEGRSEKTDRLDNFDSLNPFVSGDLTNKRKTPLATEHADARTQQLPESGDLEVIGVTSRSFLQPLARKKPSISTKAMKPEKKPLPARADETFGLPQESADLPEGTTSEKNPPPTLPIDKTAGLPALSSDPPAATTDVLKKKGTKRRSSSSSSNSPEVPSKKQKTKGKQAAQVPDTDPTVTKRTTKRQRGIDPEYDTATNPPAKKPRAMKGRPAATGTNTVIVGAGVIGLFTAFELAKKIQGDKDHTITVLDINEQHFSLASGQCFGFVSLYGTPEEWNPLLEASLPAWNELLESAEFRKFVAATSDNYSFEGEEAGHDIPWFSSGSKSLGLDEMTSCRIRSPLLGDWLRGECERLGVQFRFNMHPTAVEAGRQMIVRHTNSGKHEVLPCNDIVLAAGPFTAELFSRLYKEKSSVKLLNSVQSSEWATLRAGGVVEKNVGILIPDLTEEEEAAFDGPLALVSRRSTETVKFAACRKPTARKELRLHDAVDTPLGRSAELREVAAKHLVNPNGASLSHGSAYVSTGSKGKPVVGRVPGLASRVYVCYGFGNCGTTVAPGVGGALAAMMRGEEATVDLGGFGFGEA